MFKEGIEQTTICKHIDKNNSFTQISDQELEQAHSGDLDYLEYNQRLSVCERQGKRKRQEDRFIYGLAPKEYFALPVELRASMFKNICQMLQHDITDRIPRFSFSSGTCVLITVAHQIENKIYIDLTHIGDSLAFLIIEDDQQNILQFIRLNNSLHHVSDPEETARILSSGGKIVHGRIEGDLALARDIGNNRFEAVLNREPDFITKVVTLERNQKARTLVCCDGLPERFANSIYGKFESDKQYIEYLYSQCKNKPFEMIPYHLADLALKDGSTDNITCSLSEISDCFFNVIFDGHGGSQVAECARKLIVSIMNHAYTQCLTPPITSAKEITPDCTPPLSPCTPEIETAPPQRKSISFSEFNKPDATSAKFFKRTRSATILTPCTPPTQSTPPAAASEEHPTLLKMCRTE